MNLILGETECGDWENSFGTMRPLRLVQTQINLRIRMRMDDITSTLTVLYDGKINKNRTGISSDYTKELRLTSGCTCWSHMQ